jgi:hypothetical protein
VEASLVRGLLGVVGGFGNGDFFGEVLDWAIVFAVDIGEGLVIVLIAAGFSTTLAVVGFEAPFVCPFKGAPFVGFLSSDFVGFAVSVVLCLPLGVARGLFSSVFDVPEGVITETSGMVSSIVALCFRAVNSVATDCFLSAMVCGCSSSSMLKLVLLLDRLGSPLGSRFKPNWLPICPLLSTVTNDVRTLDRGLGECDMLLPLLAPPFDTLAPDQQVKQAVYPHLWSRQENDRDRTGESCPDSGSARTWRGGC